MTFTDAGKRRCLRDYLVAMFFPATAASLNAQLAGDDRGFRRLLNGKEGRSEYVFVAVLFALSAVLLALVGVRGEERPALLPKGHQTLTTCGAVRLNPVQRWAGQRIRVYGEVDTFRYRGAGTAVISMVCFDEGAVLISIKLFDRTDLKKAEYLRLTAGNKGSGCHTGVTVEGKVEIAELGGRVTLTDGLIREMWIMEGV